jgi:TonB family protein
LAGRETKADVQFILDRRPASRPPDAYDAKDTTAGFRVNQDPDCPPTLLRTVEPDYPLELRASGLQGIVELAATVGADGVPTDVQVVRAPGSGADTEALKAAAVNAAGQWRFAPARDYGGQPVAVPVTIQMTFRLL